MVGLTVSSFHIAGLVEEIHGSAFGEWTPGNVTVDCDNRHFRMEGDFLVDWEHRKLIRYFGTSSRVLIGKSIEVLGAGSFSGHPHVLYCQCEDGSQRCVVECEAFWNSSVLDVTLPPSVRTFERKAFVSTCHVSIPGVSGDDAARFSAWEVEREATPSLPLTLEGFTRY
jgi:hypothetical protein